MVWEREESNSSEVSNLEKEVDVKRSLLEEADEKELGSGFHN